MYRSSSWTRVTDDYSDPPSKAAPPSLRPSNSFDSNVNELPGYDPIVELARKEKARAKFAENAVHVIPFVLFLCAIVLWFFSNPGRLRWPNPTMLLYFNTFFFGIHFHVF